MTCALKTVKQFAAENRAFTVGGLRHVLFHRGDELEKTGAVIRFGHKILIDEGAFLAWLKAGAARNIRGAGE